MKKLELKHLAPYLPFDLKMIIIKSGQITGLNNGNIHYPMNANVKPILRPMDNFNKEAWMSDETLYEYSTLRHTVTSGFDHIDYNEFDNILICFSDHESSYSLNFGFYPIWEFLIKHHFDVFGLISQGLAIDINALES